MGQKISKDELVYQQVIGSNIDAIKALCTEGARLEVIITQCCDYNSGLHF